VFFEIEGRRLAHWQTPLTSILCRLSTAGGFSSDSIPLKGRGDRKRPRSAAAATTAARRQSAVATRGRIATGDTTWSLSPMGDYQKGENYQTNPILFKPAWKVWFGKAKNEPKWGIRRGRLRARQGRLGSRRYSQWSCGSPTLRAETTGRRHDRNGGIPRPFDFAQGRLSASRPTIRRVAPGSNS
jgi:hypothetical protein